MIKPIAFSETHMESSAFAESVAVLTHFFAFKTVATESGRVTLKHPNTDWLLVVNDGGADAPPKQFHHHWGVRVSHNDEIQAAYDYMMAQKDEWGLGEIRAPEYSHGSMSVYLREPGGNAWEVECFETLLKNPAAGGGTRLDGVRAPHWSPAQALTDADFPGRGYLPQAFTHGTLACGSTEHSTRFLGDVLGLRVIQAYKNVLYVKHPDSRHYVVCLERPAEEEYSPNFRNTLTLASVQAVEEAHAYLQAHRHELGLRELGPVQQQGEGASFLLKDPDRNWWELASPAPSA